MLPLLAAAFLGFITTLALMPWVMRLAREYRILDFPDAERRLHGEPVPRIGGLAIFIGVAVATLVVLLWARADDSIALRNGMMLPGFIAGAFIVVITGILDDVRGVTPLFKLTAQTIAALAAISYGFGIETVTVAGNALFPLGVLALPITILWIVGMTNAFNLIDGVDGLAGTMALIGLTSCIAVEFILHEVNGLVMTLAMAGAVLAFLRFNHHPARVFLGDSGSMLLGYFLSICTVYAATIADPKITFALLPLFALAYPLTDTFIAMARRWLRGHPISRADGRHIHHQLLALGLSPRRTVELLGLFFFCVAFMGISIVFAPPRVTLALSAAGVVLAFAAFFYGVRWLHYSEFLEFGASVQSVLLNARSHVRNKVIAGELAANIVKAGTIEEIRALLDQWAPEFRFLEISVVAGAAYYPGPAARQISPLSERPFRVDYPIAWEQGGRVHEVVLRLWCERPDERRHVGIERIATKLGAALEQWLREHPASFGIAGLADARRMSSQRPERLDG
ncbi:MAG TPA: MraY family glycosyltransferase [Gemmatimonadaceae bacterium]|nr:MraY family glycosyltransferase [Gemmatimonadaceae bacterium]